MDDTTGRATGTPASGAAAAPADNALAAGTRLHEFEIQGVIGEGGFSLVYLAFDHTLHRTVALKEYIPRALAGRHQDNTVVVHSARLRPTFEAGMRSFINEARLLAQFDHPALVKVYRFWEGNATAYMAMPLYQGRTLKQVLKAEPAQVTQAWLMKVLAPVQDALALLHAERCYHRDISPDNIQLLANDAPVLLDFGAARRTISDRTQAFTAILKPSYAPLEQYAEDAEMKQGPWTDVYALAAVMYTAITQKPPPPSVARVYQDPMQPLASRARPGFDPGFLRAIDHALAVRPEDRIASMHAFAAALGMPAPRSAPPPASPVTAAAPAQDDDTLAAAEAPRPGDRDADATLLADAIRADDATRVRPEALAGGATRDVSERTDHRPAADDAGVAPDAVPNAPAVGRPPEAPPAAARDRSPDRDATIVPVRDATMVPVRDATIVPARDAPISPARDAPVRVDVTQNASTVRLHAAAAPGAFLPDDATVAPRRAAASTTARRGAPRAVAPMLGALVVAAVLGYVGWRTTGGDDARSDAPPPSPDAATKAAAPAASGKRDDPREPADRVPASAATTTPSAAASPVAPTPATASSAPASPDATTAATTPSPAPPSGDATPSTPSRVATPVPVLPAARPRDAPEPRPQRERAPAGGADRFPRDSAKGASGAAPGTVPNPSPAAPDASASRREEKCRTLRMRAELGETLTGSDRSAFEKECR